MDPPQPADARIIDCLEIASSQSYSPCESFTAMLNLFVISKALFPFAPFPHGAYRLPI